MLRVVLLRWCDVLDTFRLIGLVMVGVKCLSLFRFVCFGLSVSVCLFRPVYFGLSVLGQSILVCLS